MLDVKLYKKILCRILIYMRINEQHSVLRSVCIKTNSQAFRALQVFLTKPTVSQLVLPNGFQFSHSS